MKLNKNILLILTFMVLGSSGLFSQKFELTADKTTVNQNQRFQVYFTFEGGDGSNLRGFRPPNFETLKLSADLTNLLI